ncbi:uncharacterized protein MELLADRAFT_68025 [Melampsora larici-populina 98AG31]|uniref:Uncharacterized protein n=1 Tax=Melampsora larici-populina (strain 98AG31 / pathotype 3-4-7) TaxID=747676 RepID=F4S5A8_MELLP|nr:uncharacterized protein MELLADRAFT_68025 [Melampsora larici-populina 98AG31]EGG00133.1 hypothetical protein MELLADRAFT_68025 [Melampsora larici-populina 98AG31]
MVTGRRKKAPAKDPDQPISVDDLCKILENLIEFQTPTHPQASGKLNRKRKKPGDLNTPHKSFTSFNSQETKAFKDFFSLLLSVKDHDLERGFGSDELVANSEKYCSFFRQGILPLYAIPCSHIIKAKEDSNPIHTSPLLGLVTYIYEVELEACWARELSAKSTRFFNDKVELGRLWEDLLTAFGDGIRTHVIDTDSSPELTVFKDILGPVQFPFVASVMRIHKSKNSPKISAKVPRALLESVEALCGASPENKELIKSPSVIGPLVEFLYLTSPVFPWGHHTSEVQTRIHQILVSLFVLLLRGLLSDVICDHSDFMYANVALQLAFTVAPLLRPVKVPGKKSPTPAEARKARTNWFKQIFPISKFGQELADEVVVKLVEMVSRQFWIGVGAIHNRLVRDDDDKARSIPIISGNLNDTKLEWDEDSIPVTRSNVQFNKSTLTWCSVDLLVRPNVSCCRLPNAYFDSKICSQDPGSKTRGIEMNAEVEYEEIARSELKMGKSSKNGEESHMKLVLYLKTPPIIEGIPIKRTSSSFLSLIISSRYDFILPRLLKNRHIVSPSNSFISLEFYADDGFGNFSLIPITPFEAIGAEKESQRKIHAESRHHADRTLSKVSMNKEHLLAVNVGHMSREEGIKAYPDNSQARAAKVEREAQSDISRDDMGFSVNSIKPLPNKTLGHRSAAQGNFKSLDLKNDKSTKNFRPAESHVPRTRPKERVISIPAKSKNAPPPHTKVVEISSSSSSSLTSFPPLESINRAKGDEDSCLAGNFENPEADHSRSRSSKESFPSIPTSKSRDPLKTKNPTLPSKPDKLPRYVKSDDEKISVQEMERLPKPKNEDEPLIKKNVQHLDKQAGKLQPLETPNDDRTDLSHNYAAQKPQLRSTHQSSPSGGDTDKENVPFEKPLKLNHLKRPYHRKMIIDSATDEPTSGHGKSIPKTSDVASYCGSEKTDELEDIQPIYKRPKVIANLKETRVKQSVFKKPALHSSEFGQEAVDLDDSGLQKRAPEKSRPEADRKRQSRAKQISNRAPVVTVLSKSTDLPRSEPAKKFTNRLARPHSPRTKRIASEKEDTHKSESKFEDSHYDGDPTSALGESAATLLKSPNEILTSNRPKVKGISLSDRNLSTDDMKGILSDFLDHEAKPIEMNRKRKSEVFHSEAKRKILRFEHGHNSTKKLLMPKERPGMIDSLASRRIDEKETQSKHLESHSTGPHSAAKKRLREVSVPASIVLESPSGLTFYADNEGLRETSIPSSIVLESPPEVSLKQIIDHYQGNPQELRDSEQISDQGAYAIESQRMYDNMESPRRSRFPSPKPRLEHLLEDAIDDHSDSVDEFDDVEEKNIHGQGQKNSDKQADRTLRFRLPSQNSAVNKAMVTSVSKRHDDKYFIGGSELGVGYKRKGKQESALESSTEWPKESFDVGVVERLTRLEKSGKRLNVDKILKGLNMDDDFSEEPGPSRQTKPSLKNEIGQKTVQARAPGFVHKSLGSEASPSVRAPKSKPTSTIWPESSRAQRTVAEPIRKERTERFVDAPREIVKLAPPSPRAQTKYTNEHEQKISECMDQLTKIIIDNLGRKKNETKSAAVDTHMILVRHAERVMNTCVKQSEQIVNSIQDQSRQTEERLVPFLESVFEMCENLDEEAAWIVKYYPEHRKKEKDRMKLMDEIFEKWIP